MNEDQLAVEFWKRVDKIRNIPLNELCVRANLDYNKVKHNRSDLRLLRPFEVLSLSNSLGVSMEYLLTGKDETHQFPQRIETIARKLTRISESNLETIETMIMALPDEESKKAAISG